MIKDSHFEVSDNEELDVTKARDLVEKARYNLEQITPKYKKAKARLDWCLEQEKLATLGRYYVYIVYVEGVPVYVGKGKGDRYKHPVSGTSSCLELNRDFFMGKYIEVRFLSKYKTEEQALKQEEFWIAHLKCLAQKDSFGSGWDIYNKCNTAPKYQWDMCASYLYHVETSFATNNNATPVIPERYNCTGE